ncbi:MAG: fatty acid desaturase [Polyangiaceae bacterium]|nr:fatty acid desaturase [Polyangiaceae bacterium]
MRIFRYREDRLPVFCFTLLFCIDLVMYALVDNVWALVGWTLVGIFPKGCVCAFNHHHQHVATFKSNVLNRLLEQMYALQTGVASNAWVLHHSLGHHVNYLDQSKDESGWTDDDGSTMGWFKYTVWNTLQAYPRAWRVGDRYPAHQRVLLLSTLFIITLVAGLTFLRPLPALCVFILPMLISIFGTVYATHIHHAGKSTDSHFVACNNTIHGVYNIATGNLGYHTAHHYRPGVHWSKLPALHDEIADKIPADCYVPAELPYTVGDHVKALVTSMRRLVVSSRPAN